MNVRSITLALLPLENLSGMPEDTLLARGFIHDLIAELSQFPSLGIVSAEAFQLLGENPAEGKGPQYVLKGSLRRWDDVLRINVQLMEGPGGQHVWAGRYDCANMLHVHDDVIAKVANALAIQMDQSILRKEDRKSAGSEEGYACWLRGMESLQRGTAESDARARELFELALKADPHHARSYCGLSLSYFNDWSCQAWQSWSENEQAAYAYAVKAEALNPNDALVQLILARIEQYRRQFDRAGPRLERAHALAPNDAYVLIQLAGACTFQGKAAQGWQFAQRALELNPLCPAWFYCFAALPLFAMRRYEEMLVVASKAPPELVVDMPAYEAVAHACLGEKEQAAACLEEFRADFHRRIAVGQQAHPDELMRWLMHVNPFCRDEDTEHFAAGLRLAGLADSRQATTAPLSWPISNVFRREGGLWMLAFEHQVAQLPELRGFHDLAKLLGTPGQEHASTDLAEVAVKSEGMEVLDEQARRAYRNRLHELEEEIASASQSGNVKLVQALEEEREHLIQQLQRAVGLGGRGRKTNDSAERARAAVTWRIRHAIRKIEQGHPLLARHLANSIRTGVFCSYRPERETVWAV